MLEARLGRVSSLLGKSILELGLLGSRTIPEDGTADDLSLAGGRQVEDSFGVETS